MEYATELRSDDNRYITCVLYIYISKQAGLVLWVIQYPHLLGAIAPLLTYCWGRSYPPDCALREYFRLFHEAAGRTGRISNIAHKLKSIAVDVGFVEATEKAKKLPWAPWPTDEKMKELGRYALLNCETSFEAFGLALFTRVLGLSKEEVMRVCSESRKELRDKKIHVYNLQYVKLPLHSSSPSFYQITHPHVHVYT